MNPIVENTKIHYLYRDAGNYKVYNECIINGILTESQKNAILDCLDDGEYFIPNLVNLPEVKFDDIDPDLDHQWFELHDEDFETTSEPPTVWINPEELVTSFEKCKNRWMDFYLNPSDWPNLNEQIESAVVKNTSDRHEGREEGARQINLMALKSFLYEIDDFKEMLRSDLIYIQNSQNTLLKTTIQNYFSDMNELLEKYQEVIAAVHEGKTPDRQTEDKRANLSADSNHSGPALG